MTSNRHATLMTISVALLATVFNTFLARRLPMFEGMVLYLHIFLWFGVCALFLPLRIAHADMGSFIYRPGSLRLRYPPPKSLSTSRIGVDGRPWDQQ